MSPGVHNITIEQYHSGPGISRSGIEAFKRSPLHYWHEYLNPDRQQKPGVEIITTSDALQFGNAFHAYVLEPQEFDKRYMVFEKGDGRTREGKATNAQAKELQGERELICAKAFRQITDMHRAINLSPTARGLIEGAVYEKSLFWVDKDTGILCKVRPDIWHSNFVVDLKTSGDASCRAFSYDLHKYGYDTQCAMVSEGLKYCTGKVVEDFVFIVVEKTAPYATACYKLDLPILNAAKERFKTILFEFKECVDMDRWEGYPDAVISLPEWRQ